METPVYSIAICPPAEVISYIKGIKDELSRQLGWYPSCNSEAHISLTQFRADDRAIKRWKDLLDRVCAEAAPFEFRLRGMSAYSQGTVYVNPDSISKEHFLNLCNSIKQRSARLKYHPFSSDPHLTIARQLDDQKVDNAFRVLAPRAVEAHFLCTGIALRKLDEQKGQYAIVHRFPFGNKQSGVQARQAVLW
jgi:2'-5' RNA ligase